MEDILFKPDSTYYCDTSIHALYIHMAYMPINVDLYP
jgi:hypothetical protein